MLYHNCYYYLYYTTKYYDHVIGIVIEIVIVIAIALTAYRERLRRIIIVIIDGVARLKTGEMYRGHLMNCEDQKRNT